MKRLEFPWVSKIGIEFTYLPKDVAEWQRVGYSSREEEAIRINGILQRAGIPIWNSAHFDDFAFEIASIPLTSVEILRTYRLKLDQIMLGLLKFTTHHKKYTTGGGHINIDATASRVTKILNDMAWRPYIGWIFSEPEDTDTTASATTYWQHWEQRWITDPDYYCNSCRADCFSARRIELRFFEMAKDWPELEAQVAWVQSYLHWLKRNKISKFKPNKPTLTEYLGQFSLTRSIREFRAMLKELNLPYSRYKEFVERNMVTRYEFGPEYLK